MNAYEVRDGLTRTANPVMARAMSESDLLSNVTTLARRMGLLVHHETDSRKSPRGFLDLVVVGKRVVFIELKTETGRLRPEQETWLTRLTRAGQDARVIRPRDWLDGTVERLLKEIR